MEANEAELVFDSLEPITVPIRIGQTRYLLKEASENAARIFRNACVKAARMTDGKVTGIEGIADTTSLLLSYCLWELSAEGKELRLVPEGLIRSWPSRITKQLFDKAKAISQLDEKPPEKDRDTSKNSHLPTMDTSTSPEN